jgi:FdhD protein
LAVPVCTVPIRADVTLRLDRVIPRVRSVVRRASKRSVGEVTRLPDKDAPSLIGVPVSGAYIGVGDEDSHESVGYGRGRPKWREDRVKSGATEGSWLEYRQGWSRVQSELIGEIMLDLYVNGKVIASVMCTPVDQAALALGFLKNEGLLERMEELEALTVSQNGCCVDTWLNHGVKRPKRKILTSGCGGGATFHDPREALPPIESVANTTPVTLPELMNRLHVTGGLYARAGGVHTSALSDGREILCLAEDVGRHNTVDKLAGMALLAGTSTAGRILLTTGRVSSDMLLKAARMGCPIVASRSSPTSLAVSLAEAWNVTLVGYVRRTGLRVYTHAERLGYRAEIG